MKNTRDFISFLFPSLNLQEDTWPCLVSCLQLLACGSACYPALLLASPLADDGVLALPPRAPAARFASSACRPNR